MDMNTIKSFIHSIFQGSGSSVLSKQAILAKVMQSGSLKSALPFFQQIPDKKDYTESSLTQEMQCVMQKQGAGSMAGKIRSKVGI
jgi:hypothetical protein